MPVNDLIKLAHRYNVPAYPSAATIRADTWEGPEGRMRWNGEAMIQYAEGADGLYMFNQFDPTAWFWRDLGDPKRLVTADKTYAWDYLPSQRKEADVYGKLRLTRGRRSVEVTENGCEAMPLWVGEDLSSGVPPGKARELALRVHVIGLTAAPAVQVKVNDVPLSDAKLSEAPEASPKDVWLVFAPDPTVFKKGENLVTATVGKEAMAQSGPAAIDQLRLNVRYTNELR